MGRGRLKRIHPAATILVSFAAGAATAALLLLGPPDLPRWPFGGPRTRLAVIGLDGADWNIIDPLIVRGEMPNLAGLIERGSRARLLSAQPMLSPVLWTTIATGVRPEVHGILDFVAVSASTGEVVPVTSSLRKVPAFWEILSGAGMTVGVTAWWATFPADPVQGYMITDRIAYQLFGVKADDDPAGKTWPPELFDEIGPLIVHGGDLPPERIAPFLGPGERPGEGDGGPGEIEAELRNLVASGDTYRGISARVAGEYRPEIEAVYIETTDTIAHLTMKFRPPLLPGVDPSLSAKFGGAVDQAYREADAWIGEVLARSGEGADVIVLSDHGFRSGPDRPASTESMIGKGKAAEWHRKYGILVLAGPHVRRGAKIEDATILDIAPTALALLGRTIPSSFQGRVLTEALTDELLEEHPPVSGPVLLERGETASLATGSSPGDHAVLEKLMALGYLTQSSLNASNNRGIILMNKGDYAGAIAEFEEALSRNASQPGVLVNLGRCLWLSGDSEGAVTRIAQALRIDPGAREAENLLGNIAMAEGDLDEAERRFRRALEIEPAFTDAHNSLGILYEARGRWNDAIAEYRRVIEIDPDYAEGYNNLGNVMKRLGRPDDAATWYRRAIEADPMFAGSYNNLALLMQDRGDLDGAEQLYGKALRINRTEPRTHNNLGSLQFLRGDYERAKEEFETAIELDPQYAEARNSLGVVQGAMGEPDREIESYRAALDLNPDYADARFNLGLALVRAGRGDDGRAEFERVLRRSPDHVPSLLALSDMARGRGDTGEAIDLSRRAAAAAPGNARTHLTLARALSVAGDRAGAERELGQALRIDPGLQEARDLLGKLKSTG